MRFTRPLAGAIAGWVLLTVLPHSDAQPVQRPARVGFLLFTSPPPPNTPPSPFTVALKDLGWTPDRDVLLEPRYASGDPARLPLLARELIEWGANVLLTGGTAATRAATSATRTIPIVFVGVGDPVSTGLVSSLARPGGNVTGIATQHPDSERKRLELLRELVLRLAKWGSSTTPTTHQVGLRSKKPRPEQLSSAYPSARTPLPTSRGLIRSYVPCHRGVKA